jgi:PPE-repeat protein
LSQLSENLADLAAFRERAMPLFNSQHQNDRGIRWRGIAATAMVELLVLFALSFAVVRYVEWSSAANQAEFMMRTERVELLTPSGIHSRTSYSNALGIVRPPDASGS